MNRPRLYRGLRITASAVCGVVCVLLIVLWIRSYWLSDLIAVFLNPNREIVATSLDGYIAVVCTPRYVRPRINWRYLSRAVPTQRKTVGIAGMNYDDGILGVFYDAHDGAWKLKLPIWTSLLLLLAFAAVPWLPWHRLRRFSLKTLLLATAIISAVLGLGVWLARG